MTAGKDRHPLFLGNTLSRSGVSMVNHNEGGVLWVSGGSGIRRATLGPPGNWSVGMVCSLTVP